MKRTSRITSIAKRLAPIDPPGTTAINSSYLMRKSIQTIFLTAVLGGLIASTQAQIVVCHDDFDQNPPGANSIDGTYGRIAYNFGGSAGANPIVIITNTFAADTLAGAPGYTHSNYCAFIFESTALGSGASYNFGWDIDSLAATGNTNVEQRAYTLAFDFQVQGDGMNGLGGFVGPVCYVFGQNAAGTTWSSGEYYGDGAQIATNTGFFPPAGDGWVHVELPLDGWGTAGSSNLITTSVAFSFGFGAYMAGLTVVGQEEIDLANVELIMNTNLAPLPGPPMTIVPAMPGLRVFAQDHSQTYNQEGFGTQDPNQSWVGVATPANPVSYAITFADFDTVNNYTFSAQFAQNASGGDPYGVYNGANAFVWSITHQNTGFTTAVNYKINAPASGTPNNLLSLTTTSTNGRGTWTLTFTNDTDGTVSAPDGTKGSFSIDPSITGNFGNPVVIDFGTNPNAEAGYGQWVTYGKIAITNVIDGDEYDDFTQDDTLNTDLWNQGFSLNSSNSINAGSVFQISTNTSYWVSWTLPDNGFVLETKARLHSGTNAWFSPAYYGSGVGIANTLPQQMGRTTKWTLVPAACLPTVDGTVGGAPSPTAFFRLSKPGPSQ